MARARPTVAIAIGLFGAMIASRAHAQSTSNENAEIALLKQQLRSMEQKLDKLQKQTTANTNAAATANAKADARATGAANVNGAIPVKGSIAPSDVVVTMPNNRPTICTADDQNCIAITSRLHFDAGGYDYRPNSAATIPQRLDDGVNARRARIGVIGKFFGDWNYALIYDFAGSSDGFASTASVGGRAVGFLPGGALSGIANAYLSYTGFKPFGGKLAIEGGYIDVPYTLDEATSWNEILFLERASSAGHRCQYCRQRLPLCRRRALVHGLVLDRRLRDGSNRRRDPLGIEHESQRDDGTTRRRCPCRRAGRER